VSRLAEECYVCGLKDPPFKDARILSARARFTLICGVCQRRWDLPLNPVYGNVGSALEAPELPPEPPTPTAPASPFTLANFPWP
jgi:hypothetical protein